MTGTFEFQKTCLVSKDVDLLNYFYHYNFVDLTTRQTQTVKRTWLNICEEIA